MRYDVIVVGAGPAGSTTARECAGRGLSVLLLDRAAFPRDKPCGGGVMVRTARLLPFDIAPVIERSISGIHFTFQGQRGLTKETSEPLAYLTQRSRLDLFLLEQAVKAGVVLCEREQIRGIERRPSHLIVRTESRTFESSTLVAADGVNGQTVKQAGLRLRRWCFVALEANVTPSGPFPDFWKNRTGIDLGSLPGGYHWLFPKGDHLNIGVGGVQSTAGRLRKRLNEVAGFYHFDPARLWGVRASLIPVRKPDAPLADGNVIIVGDAAGLIDPLTGDGIYSAIWSGRAAARQLSAFLSGTVPDLQGYRREVETGLFPDLQVSFQLWSLLHLAPFSLMEFILRRPGGKVSSLVGWDRLVRICQGKDRYYDFRKGLGFLWSPLDWTLHPSTFHSLAKLFGMLQR